MHAATDEAMSNGNVTAAGAGLLQRPSDSEEGWDGSLAESVSEWDGNEGASAGGDD